MTLRFPRLLLILTILLIVVLTGGALAQSTAPSLRPAALPLAHTEAPRTLDILGQIGGPSYAVDVVGAYAYVGIGPRLVILNLSNPANPTIAGQSAVLPDIVRAVQVVNGLAYVADDYNGGLQIISVSNPTAPVIVGSYNTPGAAYGVAVVGTTVYVADGSVAKALRISPSCAAVSA